MQTGVFVGKRYENVSTVISAFLIPSFIHSLELVTYITTETSHSSPFLSVQWWFDSFCQCTARPIRYHRTAFLVVFNEVDHLQRSLAPLSSLVFQPAEIPRIVSTSTALSSLLVCNAFMLIPSQSCLPDFIFPTHFRYSLIALHLIRQKLSGVSCFYSPFLCSSAEQTGKDNVRLLKRNFTIDRHIQRRTFYLNVLQRIRTRHINLSTEINWVHLAAGATESVALRRNENTLSSYRKRLHFLL